jgi:hypothetical protein
MRELAFALALALCVAGAIGAGKYKDNMKHYNKYNNIFIIILVHIENPKTCEVIGLKGHKSCYLNLGYSALKPSIEPVGTNRHDSMTYIAVLNETSVAEGSDDLAHYTASLVCFNFSLHKLSGNTIFCIDGS